MRASVHLSTQDDSLLAAMDVAAQARRAMGGLRVEAALCWVSPEHLGLLPQLRATLVQQLGCRRLAGCVAVGVTAGSREVVDGPAVALMTFATGLRPAPFEVRLVRRLGARPEEAARRLVAGTGPGDLLVVMPTASTFKAEPFLRQLAVEGRGASVVGGGADNPDGEDRVFSGAGETDDGVAALLIRDCAPQVRSTGACRAVSPPYVVTRCRGHRVLELDGRAALEVVREVLQRAGEQAIGPEDLVLGMIPVEAEDALGGFVVRPLAGVDTSLGALLLGEEPTVGQSLVFAVAEARSARSDLNAMLLEARPSLAVQRPAFAIWANCQGRGPHFQGIPDFDSSVLDAYLDGVPVAGFFSGFELGPLAGRTRLQLFAGVLATGG